MRNLSIYLSALAALLPSNALRHGSHQLRDLLAFPKYQIDYLNELPLSSSDAKACLRDGVEFESDFTHTRFEGRKHVSGNDSQGEEGAKLELVPMKLPSLDGASQHDYLCLMPSENSTAAQSAKEDDHEEVDPAQGWAALSHLEGKCLYTQQGYWFTYSYCHNDHIRQFRQGPHKHPHPPGGFIPEEDPRYEAYTLGRARPEKSPSAGKRKNLPDSKSPSRSNGGTSIDRLNKDNAVSYGLQPSSRYLVQRWQDGTTCELNGKPREIEVQIHCSMTTTDSIYLIKETSICNYVMIIHSPHLCGLPGFRADHSDVEMAKIRCREVISDNDFEKWVSGEEVVMPFLTIGKGLGDVEVVDGGDKSGLGEVRHEGLSEGSEGRFGGMAAEVKGGKDIYEEMQMEDGVSINGLKDALSQLLEGGGVEGEEGEVMLITLEEGDEQVILQTDIIGGEGDAGGNGIDKETILKLVKEYLRKKDKPKRDEEGDKVERDEL